MSSSVKPIRCRWGEPIRWAPNFTSREFGKFEYNIDCSRRAVNRKGTEIRGCPPGSDFLWAIAPPPFPSQVSRRACGVGRCRKTLVTLVMVSSCCSPLRQARPREKPMSPVAPSTAQRNSSSSAIRDARVVDVYQNLLGVFGRSPCTKVRR